MRERGSGSLRRRGRMWWLRYWHRGKLIEEPAGRNETGEPLTEAQARRKLRERLRTAGTPDFSGPAAERITFAELKAGIIRDYTVTKRNRSTKRLEQCLAHLEAAFGQDAALSITDDRVGAYIDARRAAGAKPATVNRELAALRRMFRLHKGVRRYAPDIRLLDESDNVRDGFADPADFAAVCEQLPAEVADVAWFAYLTCWRRRMVLELAWSKVALRWDGKTLAGGVIRLPSGQTKNKKPITVVLTGRLLEVMRRRYAARLLACPYVFHRAGTPLRDFRTSWTKATKSAGLEGLRFHDLRRSAARNLRRGGESEGVIMAMGGWKTRAMFERYNIIDERDLAEAGDRRDAYLERALTDARKVETIRPKTGTGAA